MDTSSRGGAGSSSAPAAFSSFSPAIKESVSRIVREKLGTQRYEHSRVKLLVKEITDAVLVEARNCTSSAFKVVVAATIVPADGGLCQAASVFWDPLCDGVVTHSESTEGGMIAVVNVFGCAV